MDANAQPSSPGEILKEWIDGNSITEVAQRLNITGNMLSRILNGKANISAEMAIRLSILLGTSSELWLGMQEQYDLWQAKQRKHDFVVPLSQPLNKQAKNDL
ncbi:MAG: HigA family addiction module antidote protein [Cardiobacteriaceae bacterium]|nr:HigA family addiction module antidote protein [Cardiobacteriaceae bacterium]